LLFFLLSTTLQAATYTKQNNTIYFQAQHEKFAYLILDNLEKDIDKFQRKIGQYPDLPLTIYLTENEAEYKQRCGNSQAILEFSQACYSPRQKAIILRSVDDLRDYSQLRQIILHEYIHHFVHAKIANPPLWFNEGMAVYFSGGLTYKRELNFAKNYILGNSSSLNQMRKGYPENRIEWESYYAKSALAVKYLSGKEGKKFFRFWENISKTGEFDSTFLQSFYFTSREFSTFFEQYAKQHFRLELFLASSGIIWAFLPLVFLLGVLRRKIRDRGVMKNWQFSEQENLLINAEKIEKEKNNI